MSRGTLCALVALLACAPAAQAVDLDATGGVVVRWQSNPDTCASSGLCGRSGVLSWQPTGDPATVSFEDRSLFVLDVFGTATTVWSERPAGATRAVCTDRPQFSGLMTSRRDSGGNVRFNMRDLPTLSVGHCAGPLAADFEDALPVSRPVSVRSLRRHPRIDLRSRAEFQAGPFTGVVTSTLVFTAARSRASSGSFSSESTTFGTTRGRGVRYGELLVSYAIKQVTGDFGYAFGGIGDDVCAGFDTCAMSGDLSMHPEITGGSVQLVSTRKLGPRRHETLAAGLRALRQGRTRLSGDSVLAGTGPLPLTETVTPGGGDTCTDTSGFTEPYLYMTRTAEGLRFRLLNGGSSYPDPVRTRCPGPTLSDLGLNSAFAAGSLRKSQFGAPKLELVVAPARGFSAPGLLGAGHGAMTIALELRSMKAETRTVRIVRGGSF